MNGFAPFFLIPVAGFQEVVVLPGERICSVFSSLFGGNHPLLTNGFGRLNWVDMLRFFHIDNWYVGNQAGTRNTAVIVRLLTSSLTAGSKPLDKLKALLEQYGTAKFSKVFLRDWNMIGSVKQKLIVGRFEDALNAGLLFPANSNNMDIVKPDQKDKTSKVHELRQKGDGFRVYFECDDDAIFVALYGTKTYHHGADQDADFRLAKTIVKRMGQGIM